MTWITVKRLPLDVDLSHLTRALNRLEHRITEDRGEQVIEVRDPAVVDELSQLIDEYLAGTVRLPEDVPSPPATPMLSPWQTPVTLLLIALSVVGCLLVETEIGHAFLPWFTFLGFGTYEFKSLSEGILAGEIWRLVTPAFLHFGFFHLLFNSLWLWDLGRRLELGLGARHYLAFVLMTAVAANIAQFWWSGSALFGGMSGVVYALVGFVWMRQRFDSNPLFAVPRAIIAFMLFWLVLCMSGVVDYFIAGSIANAAHLGGLAAGMLWGVVTAPKGRAR